MAMMSGLATAGTPRSPLFSESLPFQRVGVGSGATLSELASRLGCEVSAIVALRPFMIGDSFVTVLASRERPVPPRHLITALRAASVRTLGPEEVLLGFALGRPRHQVFMDERLLDHGELVLCVAPPDGWTAIAPEELRAELNAAVVALP
jgi:hypothetical protein